MDPNLQASGSVRGRVNDSAIQARGATLVLLVLLAWISSSCAQVAVSHDTPSASSELRGILTASSGQRFEYSLILPENWKGKYTLEAHPNYFKVNYLYSNPNNEAMNNPYLFGISVLTQAEWETEQKGPHGSELLARDGVVFVESIGLDNPLSGSAAEELQRMAGQVPDIVRSLSVSSVASARGYRSYHNRAGTTPPSPTLIPLQPTPPLGWRSHTARIVTTVTGPGYPRRIRSKGEGKCLYLRTVSKGCA